MSTKAIYGKPADLILTKVSGRWLHNGDQVIIKLIGDRYLIKPTGPTTMHLSTARNALGNTYKIIFDGETGGITSIKFMSFFKQPDVRWLDCDTIFIPGDHALIGVFHTYLDESKSPADLAS